MTRLTRDDLSVIDGNALVSESRLATALGISHIHKVREIYRRHKDELLSYGPILTQSEEKVGKGRPKLTYLFNEEQALLICMFSRTEKAAEARRNLIEVFQAVRRGDLYTLEAMRQHRPDPFKVQAEHATQYLTLARNLAEADEFVREVTHLPIWPSKRRPAWWHDIEVRDFLTVAHRQMSTIEAEKQGTAFFGARCPRKSTIGEYWLRLDQAKTGVPHVKRRRPGKRQCLPALPRSEGN